MCLRDCCNRSYQCILYVRDILGLFGSNKQRFNAENSKTIDEAKSLLDKSKQKNDGYGTLKPLVYSKHIIKKSYSLSKSNDSIELAKKYKFGKQIGVGQSSKCYSCLCKENQNVFACKIIDLKLLKTKFTSNITPDFNNEIKILSQLNHENIIKLEEYFIFQTKTYIILEYMNGGELFERIISLNGLQEKEAKNIFSQICCAVTHIHNLNIIHRDIKPENILLNFDSKSETSVKAKLIDFGFSKKMKNNFKTSSFFRGNPMGTEGYQAPEILQTSALYSKKIDIWALGVTLYVMLSSTLPFQTSIVKNKKYNLEFKSICWSSISEETKQLIKKMLTKDYLNRPKIEYCSKSILNIN